MRRACRIAGTLALLAGAACAHVEAPPGGPEDRLPPLVVAQRPDSFSVVPGWDSPVLFEFSERISEQGVEEAVMVSPRTSAVRVDRGSRSVRVSLRSGWEPDRIYHVTLRPDIQDLFNNRLPEAVRVIFSTGPAIPETRLAGVVIDRISGEPQLDVRVEAIRAADSLVYAVPSDSAGRFVFEYVPEGEYLLRAFPDRNINRRLDSFEERDSLAAVIGPEAGEEVRLSVVMPDSTAPAIASARATGPRRIEVQFDDYLDPGFPISTDSVTVTGPDGAALPVEAVGIGGLPPEDTATADTAVAPAVAPAAPGVPVGAADTVAAADSLLVADTGAVAAGAVGDTVEVPVTDTLPGQAVALDTATVDPAGAVSQEPELPSRTLVIQLVPEANLQPEVEYGVVVRGAVNIVGLRGDAETTFEGPPPEPEEEPAAAEEPEAPPENEPQIDAAPGG